MNTESNFRVLKALVAAPVPPPDHGGIINWTRIMRRGMSQEPSVSLTFIDTTLRYRAVTNNSLTLRLIGGSAQALRDTYRLYRRLRNDRPDVLHLCTSGGPATLKDILMLQMAKWFGVPSIIHYRMGRLPGIAARGGIEWRLTSRAMSLASVVVPLDNRSEACVKTVLPNDRIARLPNMVEIDVIDAARKALEASHRKAGPCRVLFAGHVLPAKGVKELVLACARLHNIPLTLDVVGPVGSSFRRELVEAAAVRGNGSWLRLHGTMSHEETIRRILQADLFVLPSYTEGMPNVVLEAMACGVAIVATTVGAIPEMLDIGGDECGVCVPPRDVDALAAALASLADNSDAREKLAIHARRRAEEYYSVPVACEQLLNLWRSVSRKSINNGSGETP